MDYNRICEYRINNVDEQKKFITRHIIADHLYKKLNYPASVIVPATGECEFIIAYPDISHISTFMEIVR
jgi:hypothetical protein